MEKKDEVFLGKFIQIKILIGAFIVGLVYGYCFPLHLVLLLVQGTFFIAISFLWRHRQIILLTLGIFLLFSLGVIRMNAALHVVSPATIDFYNGQQVTIEGIIDTAPDKRPDRMYLLLSDIVLMHGDESSLPLSGKVLITTTPFKEFSYGDIISVQGVLQTPKDMASFQYKQYLAKDGIYAVMDKPFVKVREKGKGNSVMAGLFSLRDHLEQRIQMIFPEPSGSLMAGLLLGIRKTMPAELTDALSVSGLTHIIAISGFNITLIITFVAGFLLASLRRGFRFIFATTAIVLFVLLVGPSASVVRAAVMGVLGLMALTMGRTSDALHTLFIALFIMTLLSPLSLILDVGFQLSFAATLGLILLSPIGQRWCANIPSCFGIKEMLITTLSAQVIVLPIILSSFGRLSLIAPLSNILVLPLIPLTMLFGFVALLADVIPFFFILAKLIGFFAWVLLQIILFIVYFCADMPFASVTILWWNGGHSIGFYSMLLIGYMIYSRRRKARNEKF